MRPQNVYEMWHQKRVDSVTPMEIILPRRLTRLGRGKRIVYESDKWEADGDFYPYQHEFGHPDVFVAHKQGEIDTRDFLGLDDLENCQLDWVHLGVVEELRYRAPESEKKTVLRFSQQPFLCCTPECDTLVIMSSPNMYFVRGGTMRVTERGIVD